ncbi:MAG: bifunctional oligoribonuclease/PAP phosphatase NrnA [Flavobacteriales bacterium]|nr:bifunctional oligoribonuclease/PAP phosphatase NrnA [Flavobacteriales bacterium]
MSFPSAPTPQVDRLRDLLATPRRIAIVSHYNPDGDAVGSSQGLAHVLRQLGHTVHVVLPNRPPAFLDFVPGSNDRITFDKDPDDARQRIQVCELLFCLDFNRQDRVGGLERVVRDAPSKVLIDHHQDPEDFAELAFSDTYACATCQMVFDIISAMGHAGVIDREAATCLYTGLVTDSGSFRFPSTTPHTMRVAAALMERGVDIASVHGAIMDDNSEDRMRLLGLALGERMRVLPDLRTVIIGLSGQDMARHGSTPGDTEGFVNHALSIRGTRLAAFFVERPDMVKISLRSKGDLPVDRFLKEHFNGGGHRNAAGGQSNETLEATIARFERELPKFLQQHPA